MKVWILKYAMSTGIYCAEGKQLDGNMCIVPKGRGRYGLDFDQYFHGREWAFSEQESRAIFADMKARKIASLKKSLAKVEALEFPKQTEK